MALQPSAMLQMSRFSLGWGSSGRITRADRARDMKQWRTAARLYREALDRNPRNPPIWVQLGHALKELALLDEAETAYRRAIGCDPGLADPHQQLGHALKLQGRTDEAQSCYLLAFVLDPIPADPVTELVGLGWTPGQLAELQGMAEVCRASPNVRRADATLAR